MFSHSDFPSWLALVAAMCIGLSKAGFSGVSLVAVAIFAELHGAKQSVGLVLPLLIAADLMAWPAFRRHGSWRPVWHLLGPALAGMAAGWWLMGRMDDHAARKAIGLCVLVMVAMHFLRKWQPETTDRLVEKATFHHGAGFAGGVATFLANAAGPVIQLYLAATRMPKMELLGVAARFFLLINLLKLPLNAQLALITPESLLENIKLLPAVIIGVFVGRWLVCRVPQRAFEWMIAVFALVSSCRLLFF